MGNKYQYRFANGDVSVLYVSDDWYTLLQELDRQEANNDQREQRRHCSLEQYNRYDNQFPMPHGAYETVEEHDTWEQMCKNLTEQETLIGNLYFRQGLRQTDLTGYLGLSRSRITQIIMRIRKKLQRTFYNY